MELVKFKTIQILSNGSLNFCYRICGNSKLLDFLEKDHKNFHLNIKKTNNTIASEGRFSSYKNKYLTNK
jgi:hypothetical protein